MKKIFSSSVVLASTICVLFWCVSAFSKTTSDRSDGSTEKGTSSFLSSNIKKSDEIKNKVKEKYEINKEDAIDILSSSEILDKGDFINSSINKKNEDNFSFKEDGLASWYGENLHGKITANGELFDMNEMTAAHKSLPFGTLVEVFDNLNGLSVVVRINDRGPFVDGRIINLSYSAAEKINLIRNGIAKVKIRIINTNN